MGSDGKDRLFTREVITVIGVKAALLFVLWLVFFSSAQAPTAVDVGAAVLGPSGGTGVQMMEGAHER